MTSNARRLHLLFVYLGLPSFSRITRHDAVASVRRAYTPEEVSDADPRERRAALPASKSAAIFFFAWELIAWKQSADTI